MHILDLVRRVVKILLTVALIAALIYDFEVRFIHSGYIYFNDILLFILLPLLIINFREWSVAQFFLLFVIPFYLLFILLLNINSGVDSLLRDGQYIVRYLFAIVFYLLVVRYDFSYYIVQLFRKSTVVLAIIGIVVFVLLRLGIDLLPYTSGRLWLGTRQLSSVFSEPALYGQLVVTFFFVSYDKISDMKMDVRSLIIIGLSLVLCQSAGAIFSIIIFILIISLKGKSFAKTVRDVFIVIVGLVIVGYTVYEFLPDARVFSSIKLSATGSELDRSGEIRVLNELESLKKFFISAIDEIAFGLKAISTNDFREVNVDSQSGDMVGNGLVESMLRYGVVFLLLLYTSLKGVSKSSFLMLVLFTILITQIDGAIGKPWAWFYIVLFLVKKSNRRYDSIRYVES